MSERQTAVLVVLGHVVLSTTLAVCVLPFRYPDPFWEPAALPLPYLPESLAGRAALAASLLVLLGTTLLLVRVVRRAGDAPVGALSLALLPQVAAVVAARSELLEAFMPDIASVSPLYARMLPGIQLRAVSDANEFGLVLAAALLASWLFWNAVLLAARERAAWRTSRAALGVALTLPVLLALGSLPLIDWLTPVNQVAGVALVVLPCVAFSLLVAVRATPSLMVVAAIGSALSLQAWTARLIADVEACELPFAIVDSPATKYEMALGCSSQLPPRWAEVFPWLPGALVVALALVVAWRMRLWRSFGRAALVLVAPLAVTLLAGHLLLAWVLGLAEAQAPVAKPVPGFVSREPTESAPPAGTLVVTPNAVFSGGDGALLLTEPWAAAHREGLVALLASRRAPEPDLDSNRGFSGRQMLSIAVDLRLSTLEARALFDAALDAGVEVIWWSTNEEREPVDRARPTSWIAHCLAQTDVFVTRLVRASEARGPALFLVAGAVPGVVSLRGGPYEAAVDVSREPGRGEFVRYLGLMPHEPGTLPVFAVMGEAKRLDTVLSTLTTITTEVAYELGADVGLLVEPAVVP